MQMVLASVVWLTAACGPMLEIGMDSGTALRLPLGADTRFSVTYWHSLYDVPFTEDYVVDRNRNMRLVDLRSKSGAVYHYFGLEGYPGEVQAMNRKFPSILFAVATKKPQALTIGNQVWSFREFGSPGAQVLFTAHLDCKKSTIIGMASSH